MNRNCTYLLGILCLACGSGCGSPAPGTPDGQLQCLSSDDCQTGYICRGGECIEKPACTDFDGDGFCDDRENCEKCTDCNDNRDTIHPGAEELCDGIDNDCDGEIDEDCPCITGETRQCGTDTGACRRGMSTCQEGVWGPCEDSIEPSDEDCGDGLDNDCNGAVDDGCPCTEGESRPCGSNLGACTQGVQRCEQDAGEWSWGACTGGTPPRDEVCGDGIDNDCDGALDNGCACDGESRPCGMNIGICHTGIQHCANDVWGPCDGARGPEDEVCDGLDNDCDRITDEGCECIDGLFEACGDDTGECRKGTRRCEQGSWGPCEGIQGPADELCDGKDNDCDGATDEDFPELRETCTAGTGACARPGVMVCTEDQTGLECSASPGQPGEEHCDGIDNDCDGDTDENFPNVGGECTVGTGLCANTGEYICDAYGNVVCSVQALPPQQEMCDDADNDCDGFVDENFPLKGSPCSAGQGECYVTGTYVCSSDGSVTECDAQPPAGSTDLCDGLDNDCDGVTDEDFPGLGEVCEAGLGVCLRLGVMVCTGDGNGVVCSASAGPSSEEVCDGLDNDCDGQVDEEIVGTGEACTIGLGECLATATTACMPSGDILCDAPVISPENERCDGLDNDCDGFTDENFSRLGLACSVGVGQCYAEGTYVCSADQTDTICDAVAGSSSAEDCDGVDNDCDGETDEEWMQACSTACGDGYRFCVNGAHGPCSAREPDPDDSYCDGFDNDCDGLVDEDVANLGDDCQAGQGACLSLGYIVCDDQGGTVCNANAGTPEPEGDSYGNTCVDGIDNDCDGDTDDNDEDCLGGCKNLSARDMAPIQLLGLGLGIVIGTRKRRKRKPAGGDPKGGRS